MQLYHAVLDRIKLKFFYLIQLYHAALDSFIVEALVKESLFDPELLMKDQELLLELLSVYCTLDTPYQR